MIKDTLPFPNEPGNLPRFELSAEDLQAHSDDNSGWMITYLDVFILTAALFASLLVLKPSPDTLADSRLRSALPAEVAMHRTPAGEAALDIGSAVLFGASEATLSLAGAAVIDQLLPIIQETRDLIIIEGHSDASPINTVRYPSNWELAGARAMSVLHYLVAQGVDRQRLRMVSYADTQPLLPNTTEDNRRKNRRVSIVLRTPD